MKKFIGLCLVLLVGSSDIFCMEKKKKKKHAKKSSFHMVKKEGDIDESGEVETSFDSFDFYSTELPDLSTVSEENLAKLAVTVRTLTAKLEPKKESIPVRKHDRNIYDELNKRNGSNKITKEKLPIYEYFSDEESTFNTLVKFEQDPVKLTDLSIKYYTENSSPWKDALYESYHKMRSFILSLGSRQESNDKKIAQLTKEIKEREKSREELCNKNQLIEDAKLRHTNKKMADKQFSLEKKQELESRIERKTSRIETVLSSLQELEKAASRIRESKGLSPAEYDKKMQANKEKKSKLEEKKLKLEKRRIKLEENLSHISTFIEKMDGEGSLSRRLGFI